MKLRLSIILSIIVILLLIPFIGMQFTDEINWTLFDFIAAFILLFTTGIVIDFVIRKVPNIKYKTVIILLVLILLFLIWIELAVGVFGTIFQES
jgi:hypothetical protein